MVELRTFFFLPMRGLGSGHVTCGPMRGLKKNCMGRGQTHGYRDSMTELAQWADSVKIVWHWIIGNHNNEKINWGVGKWLLYKKVELAQGGDVTIGAAQTRHFILTFRKFNWDRTNYRLPLGWLYIVLVLADDHHCTQSIYSPTWNKVIKKEIQLKSNWVWFAQG